LIKQKSRLLSAFLFLVPDNKLIPAVVVFQFGAAFQAKAHKTQAVNLVGGSNLADGSHCSIRPEHKAPMQANILRFLKKEAAATGGLNAQ
jgi:hypothetical protein